MDIPPTGRQITNGKRNLLENRDIKEAILSIASIRNQGFQKFRDHTSEIINIPDKILLSLAIS